MRVYVGEHDRGLATVYVAELPAPPTDDEIDGVLRDIAALSRELGGLGRPDDRWDDVMARKRDLIERIEATQRAPRPQRLPNPFAEAAGTFDWSTPTGASELAAAVLSVELGETPPPAVYEPFAAEVVRHLPADRFRLERAEVWQWVEAHRQLVESELYLDPRPPAFAVVDGQEVDVSLEPPAVAGPTASALVQACEEAWSAIQGHHPLLPDAVIILGSGVERGRLVKLGHWWGGRWIADGQVRGEVLLAGEALHLPPDQVFEVLLHESAHGLNAARGIKDTSRGGRYHNAHFAQTATEVGLVARNMPPYGLASTELAPLGRERYGDTITRLGEAMGIARQIDRSTQIGVETGAGQTAGDGGAPGAERSKVHTAQCGCGRRLRMAPSVLAAGPVICGVCEGEFTVSKSAERAADAVVDRTFLARRQAALEADRSLGSAVNEGHLATVLDRERAKLGAALAVAGDLGGAGALVPLQERRDRLSRLVDDLQVGGAARQHTPTLDQREGIRELLALGEDSDVARLREWYERFASADEAPMPVASETDRQQHVALARSLLKADGTLTGPTINVGGQEFMAGDRLVVDRDVEGPMPAGALGTIEQVDSEGGELHVDFATLGRIRVSIRDAVARQLRHDYAEVTAGADIDGCDPEALAREAGRLLPGVER